VKGIWSCSDLTELTFGDRDVLGDLELVSIVKKCPKFHTLRILGCKQITLRLYLYLMHLYLVSGNCLSGSEAFNFK
jgi:hypothetical protein